MAKKPTSGPSSTITVGNILLWIAFLISVLPFFNVFHYVDQVIAYYAALAALLFLGFGISCFQDFCAKAAFSYPRLIFFATMVFIHFFIVRPMLFDIVVSARK